MINWDRLDELRNEIGPDDLAEVVDMFLAEAEEVVLRLESGCGTTAEDLHFLKGSAANLGLATLSRMCAEGESSARRDPGFVTDAKALRSAFDAARGALLVRLEGNE